MGERTRWLYLNVRLGVLIALAAVPSVGHAADWIAAERQDAIAYFLFAAPPRIERYDLAAERWLTSIPVPANPVDFEVDASRIYLIAGPNLIRVPIAGGAAETVYTADRLLLELVHDDDFVFLFAGNVVWSVSKVDGSLIDARLYHYPIGGLAIAPRTRRLFGWSVGISPSDQLQIPYAADGRLSEQIDGPYHGDFGHAQRNWVIGDQTRVATESGIVFTADDMFFAGSLDGTLLDLDEGGFGIVVLRERSLSLHSNKLLEVGRGTLAKLAKDIFVYGNRVFAFAPTNTRPEVESVLLSHLVPPVPPVPPAPESLAFTPDAILAANDGNLYLLSKIHRAIYRWSVAEGRYLGAIGLIEVPEDVVYSAVNDSLYVTYATGRITSIDLSGPIETSFASTGVQPQKLLAFGGRILVSGFERQSLFDRNGALIAEGSYGGAVDLLWVPSRRRIFSIEYDTLGWSDVSPAGQLSAFDRVFDPDVAPPLRLSADESRIFAAPNQIFSVEPVESIGTLPAEVVDAAWSGLTLFTVRAGEAGSLLEQWSPALALRASKRIIGAPLALVPIGDGLVVVTSVEGRPRFELDDAVEDFDADGVSDSADNCANVPNSDQRDLDEDRRGDLCDPYPVDPDDDGILPDVDNCPRTTNLDQSDADQDRVGDACDPQPNQPNDLNACREELAEMQVPFRELELRIQADERRRDLLEAENGAMGGERWCAGDVNIDGQVTVDEVLVAVGAALEGCSPAADPAFTGARTFAGSRTRTAHPSQLEECLSALSVAELSYIIRDLYGQELLSDLEHLIRQNTQLRDQARCAADTDRSATITVDEVIAAVGNALEGCGPGPSPTPVATATATSAAPNPTRTATATATPTVAVSPVPPTATRTLRPAAVPSDELPIAGVRRYGAGNGSWALALADFNADGRADIATANYFSDDVSLLLATASEVFAPQRRFAVAEQPKVIRVADLDVDGNIDIVTLNAPAGRNPGSLSVLLGGGDGTFAAEQRLALEYGATDFRIDFYDADRIPDLAIAYKTVGGALQTQHGNGDGTFTPASVIYSSQRVGASVAGADIDGNGTADLVTINDSLDATVLLGDGRGSFSSSVFPLVQAGVSQLALGDLDGDALPELLHLVGYDSYGHHYQYRNKGGGTFEYVYESDLGDSPRAIVTVDFNGDGAPDVATANYVGDDVTVLFNDGDGGFGDDVCIGAGKQPSDIASLDAGGDGLQDIVVALGSNDVAVIPGRGDGSFAIGQRVEIGYAPSGIASADFDQDGYVDLAVVQSFRQMSVTFGDAEGAFASAITLTAGESLGAVAAADVDGDGRADLLTAVEHGWLLWRNQGNRSFAQSEAIRVGRGISGFAVADLNRDGIPDVATANEFAADVAVSFGSGGGRFLPAQRLRIGDYPRNVFAVDVDRDGALDLLTLNQRDLSLLLGDGNGGFGPDRRIHLPEGIGFAAKMAIADLNRDGNLDVAMTTFGNSEEVIALLGDGGGDFATSAIIPGGDFRFAVDIAADDINYDGHIDLVVPHRNSFDPSPIFPPVPGEVAVYLGRGDGTFALERRLGVQTASSPERGVYGFGANPVAVELVDLNADGGPEIVTVNGGSADLTILWSGGPER